MSNWRIVMFVLALVVMLALVGFVLPALISAKSFEAVGFGLVIILVMVMGTAIILKNYLTKEEEK
jgi:hypothetical protein